MDLTLIKLPCATCAGNGTTELTAIDTIALTELEKAGEEGLTTPQIADCMNGSVTGAGVHQRLQRLERAGILRCVNQGKRGTGKPTRWALARPLRPVATAQGLMEEIATWRARAESYRRQVVETTQTLSATIAERDAARAEAENLAGLAAALQEQMAHGGRIQDEPEICGAKHPVLPMWCQELAANPHAQHVSPTEGLKDIVTWPATWEDRDAALCAALQRTAPPQVAAQEPAAVPYRCMECHAVTLCESEDGPMNPCMECGAASFTADDSAEGPGLITGRE